jgi:hypothetical protein
VLTFAAGRLALFVIRVVIGAALALAVLIAVVQ